MAALSYGGPSPCYRPFICPSVVCLSVHLTITRVDQSKTVEVSIIHLSAQSCPIPLVLRYKFNPEIMTGRYPWVGCQTKMAWGKQAIF